MTKETRVIINFWELSEEWQEEAISNLDKEIAEESRYLEPLDNQNPIEHVLWDLNECYPVKNEEYNAVIGISNNSALTLKIDDKFESAEIWYL